MEPWILPVVQGYIEIQSLVLHSSNPPNTLVLHSSNPPNTLVLHSSNPPNTLVLHSSNPPNVLQTLSTHREPAGVGRCEEGEGEEGGGDMITFSPKLDGE